MKRPAFQFYPADWRKHPGLRMCSIGARGLWIELCCIAHECEPYGHLMVAGKPMTTPQIARMVGISARECGALLCELAAAGVSDCTEQGAIFSRRMVKDEALRVVRAAGGEAGAEHGVKGAVHGSKGGRPKKVRGVSEPPLNPPPSSSSSSSSSASTVVEKPLVSLARSPEAKRAKPRKESPEHEKFPEWYQAFPRHVGRREAAKAYRSALNRGATPEDLLSGGSRFGASQVGKDREFIPHPATWLNGDRWKDEALAASNVTQIDPKTARIQAEAEARAREFDEEIARAREAQQRAAG